MVPSGAPLAQKGYPIAPSKCYNVPDGRPISTARTKWEVRGTMNQRPTGVTILAILAFVFGALGILGSLALLGVGSLLVGSGFGGLAFIFGILALALGFLYLWIGYGFWTLKNSAWRIGMLLFGVPSFSRSSTPATGYSNFASAIMPDRHRSRDHLLPDDAGRPRRVSASRQKASATDAIMGAIGMGSASWCQSATPPAATAPPAAPPAEPPAAPPPASTWTGSGESGGTTPPPSGGSGRPGPERLVEERRARTPRIPSRGRPAASRRGAHIVLLTTPR